MVINSVLLKKSSDVISGDLTDLTTRSHFSNVLTLSISILSYFFANLTCQIVKFYTNTKVIGIAGLYRHFSDQTRNKFLL